MHVIVLGAGVVGTTTAYYLSQLRCQVTVFDRASNVGIGASYANAGQLSYNPAFGGQYSIQLSYGRYVEGPLV